jgi:hypothetical protein|tara:strand:- start:385 stop:795 length:411 start_codon:yes stop_codon:yes gene_type:complete
VWNEVCAGARRGDGLRVVRLLGGRGTGLTPAGDDVIAGLLLSASWSDRGAADEPSRVAVADSVRSSDLSRSFLHWAARGHSIGPVHALLCAASGDRPERFGRAIAQVASIGASSGRSLLVGLTLGLDHGVSFRDRV